ncbi:hypothetical protein [Jeotgalicoccus halotolerans]|uniref:Uncharacterized protein n=1 Tax=Jeotgalicoccus halotolerans TaxID=157227 RepID=A0A3E0B1N1_9STAP|nr:hypothetical protein [Jeotgalicoccus halotolerans]REG25879.1 hypothetical protein DFR63_0927 [Jeotgalicoccus halotolerans]
MIENEIENFTDNINIILPVNQIRNIPSFESFEKIELSVLLQDEEDVDLLIKNIEKILKAKHISLHINPEFYFEYNWDFLNNYFLIKNIEHTEKKIVKKLFYMPKINSSLIKNNNRIIKKFSERDWNDSYNYKLIYLITEANNILKKIEVNNLKHVRKQREISEHIDKIESLLKEISR